ncbi:hypothetical protein OF117_01285 [Geodermatophilus sp. YIM 151500]|uniref:SCO7613 C-terminal domain-containing membrane protein n=1 Tax=Geodermatophilus sp. YIM 151500 TaxID=2984531 RepID=UPI0021E3A337|nr:hypothetical protein [Geodermatophilus sp. YIM 151500]MCV2487982.1 hypothetical protein [Geodermatophilus sp. YIM 151500]
MTAPEPAPCPTCGLPAAGRAALVVARIGATLSELAADRDALLATLRAAAAASAPSPPPAPGPPPPAPGQAPAAPPARPGPPSVPAAPAARVARRPRLSPQQVLVALGALLVVAAAVAFVAVAWTRLGVAFQAAVMSVVTGLACAASAWTARRGLRATEEALAAAGVALLVVDLTAARALGLLGLDGVPLRSWTAATCAAVLAAGLLLGRVTASTATWPLTALLAVQALPFLLLPPAVAAGPVGVAVALALAVGDVLAVRQLRPRLRPVALALAAVLGAGGGTCGLAVAGAADAVDSWWATAVLTAAGGTAAALTRLPVPARLPSPAATARLAAAVPALALALSLRTLGPPGPVVAGALGLALLTAAVPLVRHRLAGSALTAGGATLAGTGVLLLVPGARFAELAALSLAAVLPAVTAAVGRPALRSPATAGALLAAASAVALARAAGLLQATSAGLLLALLAAAGFSVAAARAGRPEERPAAGAAALTGLAAGVLTATAGAWGQVGVQLTIAGTAMAAYALAARHPRVAGMAVAQLVAAAWIALAGAAVGTPEAYSVPAALGLLIVALPRIRAGESSWSAEGAALAVACGPSAVVLVAEPTALRLALVVAGAGAITIGGSLLHRQAPFVVGAATLAWVAAGLLGPDVLLLPRWLTLGTVGLLLLVAGATYEQRRRQAREAVAWVAQMR